MDLVIDSFKAGFDWLKLSKFYTWFGILLIALLAADLVPFVGFVIAIGVAFAVDFMLFPRVLKHYGQKSPFGQASVDSFVAWLKYLVINAILPMINWRQRKILMWQIGAIVGALIFGILGAFIHSLFLILAGIAGLAGFVLLIYNTLRYSQALPVRLVEKNSTFISFDRSWELTAGKELQVLALGILIAIFSMIIFGIVLGIGATFFLGGALLSPDNLTSLLSDPTVLAAGFGAAAIVFTVITSIISAFIVMISTFAQAVFYVFLKKMVAVSPRRKKR